MEVENLNPDLEKVKELAVKLKTMAERGGTENERKVAEKKLSTLLKKYGLVLQDIYKNKIKERCFVFKHEDEKMVVSHVLWTVVPSTTIISRVGKQKKAYCVMTTEQYIEAKEKLNHYLKHFRDARDNFIIAFILKNNLQVKEASESIRKISFDSKSVSDMMRGISKTDYESENDSRKLKEPVKKLKAGS